MAFYETRTIRVTNNPAVIDKVAKEDEITALENQLFEYRRENMTHYESEKKWYIELY